MRVARPGIAALLGTAIALSLLALSGCGTHRAPVPAPPLRPAGPVDPKLYFGFNDNGVLFGDVDVARDAALTARAGANAIRLVLAWDNVEGQQGRPDWQWSDRLYAAMHARRIRPVWILFGTPAWAQPLPCPSGTKCFAPASPDHLADLGRFAVSVVERYPATAAIEVWNEPNFPHNWIAPSYLVRMLRTVHDALARAGSHVPVLSGGIGAAPANGDRTEKLVDYVRDLYAAGGKGAFDGLAFHPYQCAPCDSASQAKGTDRLASLVGQVLAVRNANHDRVPLWLDEIGLSTTDPGGGVDAATQAVGLVAEYHYAAALRDVRGVFVHTLVETAQPPSDIEHGFGVVARDTLAPKPAFCALAAVRGVPCR